MHVVRDDGKEFLIKRSMVAEHINRGNFKVKNKADEPTLQERKDAVGFNLKSAEPKPTATGAAEGATATVPEEEDGEKPLEDWTVPELKEEAKRLELEIPSGALKADIVELISVHRQAQ